MAKKGGSKGKGGGAKNASADGRVVVATNRRARFEYEVLDTFECGMALAGPEVKSLREGKASLVEAYAVLRRGEVWLRKMHIPPYEPATRANGDPVRDRKLLLHRAEIRKIDGRIGDAGVTLVPLQVYFKDGARAKCELGLVRGKRMYDKRESIKRRDADREAQRSMRRGARR